MHVLSPEGRFIFASESARELTGYSPDELFTRSIFDFIHADDVTAFKRDFETSCRTGDTLTLYYRFKTSDDRHVLFEVTGHPYYEGGKPQQTPDQPAKCFFATSRPYPSKNQALLDSFLELKFENERLRQELLVMYKEVEGNGSNGCESSHGPAKGCGELLTRVRPRSVPVRAARHVPRGSVRPKLSLRHRPVNRSCPDAGAHPVDVQHIRRPRDRYLGKRDQGRWDRREEEEGESRLTLVVLSTPDTDRSHP